MTLIILTKHILYLFSVKINYFHILISSSWHRALDRFQPSLPSSPPLFYNTELRHNIVPLTIAQLSDRRSNRNTHKSDEMCPFQG